jgi:glucose-6-phosphate 1-dehydrogenase
MDSAAIWRNPRNEERRMNLSPDVTIAIGAKAKRPGEELIGDPAELRVVNHPCDDERGAYERLLSDAMAGDGTLFAGQDGVEAAWAVVQSILGKVTPVHIYEPGTWGPSEAHGGISGCPNP